MSAKSTPESFWNRVNIRGAKCWEWTGATNVHGYGILSYRGTHTLAHRIAYLLTHDTEVSISTDGDASKKQYVLHSCDNRKCCRPSHLRLGNYSDNQLDAYRRDRRVQPKGSAHANSKLTPAQVVQIRARYKNGDTQVCLGKEFGVSQVAISLITRERTYRENRYK